MEKNYFLSAVLLFSFAVSAQNFQLVKDVNPSGNGMMLNCSFREMNGKLYYIFTDESIAKNGLFVSDGTSAGTYRISPDNVDVQGELVVGGNKIYFYASESANGREPWVSDGTAAGTMMLKNINPSSSEIGLEYAGTKFLSADATKAFFLANDGATGSELWVTDGTVTGTHLVKEIYLGAQGTVIDIPTGLGTNMKDGKLYFFALNGNNGFTVNGIEPWVSDGTEAGTFMLADIYPGYSASSEMANSKQFIEFAGNMYFFAKSGIFTSGLYKTDGTTAGTQLVYATSFNRIDEFKVWNGQLYFTFSNGPALYVSDGTAAGTTIVATIPDAQLNNLATCQMVDVNGTLYLRAVTNNMGAELFKLNGSQIVNVKDIWTGIPSGMNGNVYYDKKVIQVYDNKVWFLGTDGSQAGAMQVWKSDGTAGGTIAMTPLNDGGWAGAAGNSYNLLATSIGLFAIYTNPTTGSELYRYNPNVLGVNESSEIDFTVYPNPSNGILQVEVPHQLVGSMIHVHDLTGRTIRDIDLTDATMTLNLSAGVYLLTVENPKSKLTKKVIIK